MLTVTNHTDSRSSSSDADFGTVLNLFAPCGWVFAPWSDDTTPRTPRPVRFAHECRATGIVGMTVDNEGRAIRFGMFR